MCVSVFFGAGLPHGVLMRSWLIVFLVAACGLAAAHTAEAAGRGRGKARQAIEADSTGKPAEYRSQHFLLRTDLPSKEAKELLTRLETMLSLISSYWRRTPSGVIECYVVKDLSAWPSGTLD